MSNHMSRGNAEADSMDGIVDCGVGLGTNTSPHHAAIEKAQAKLRQEYDVREERKRELEFLEKGGNPLDFNFGHAASNSLQSTSFSGRPAEQYVISEAKGSFALAASPQGDSTESSGRPGGSVDRETNIADNLLLFDGENSNPSVEKSVKRTRKRGNSSLHVQSSGGDGCSHAMGTEGSLIFHLGVKNQAYARRNRSRTSRDCHGNKSTVPSSFPDHMEGNISVREARAVNNGRSYVSNSKPASPNGHVTSSAPSTDNKLYMELDGVQIHHTNAGRIKGGVREGEQEVNLSETMQNINQPNLPGGQVAKDEATSVDIHLVSPGPTGNVTDTTSVERVDSIPAKDTTEVHDDDLSRSNCDIVSVADDRNLSNVKADTYAEKENRASGNADSENFDVVRSEESRPNVESKGSSVLQKSTDNKGVKENGPSDGVDALITSTDQQPSVPPNLTNSIIRVKDEVESCDNKTDIVSKHENLRTNGPIVSKPERKLANFLGDSSHSINKSGVITSSLVGPACEPLSTAFSKRSTSTTSAVQNSEANHIRLAKKTREDAILKEARIIETNLKRAAQLSTSYKSLERGKFHWDFVLEEMAWMANDFMQERLWKTAAAAHVGHCIASTGRSNFAHATIHRKQRNVARTLAKSVMRFWHAADVVRTTVEAPKGINGECNSDLLKSYKVNEAFVKDQGSKYMEAKKIGMRPAIQGYAVRFLQYDCSTSPHSVLPEAPTTPDRVNDTGISKGSWDDEFSEESLFYTVPPGAMQLYRESVESQWLNSKKMVNTANQEDCEASHCDSLPEGPQKNQYEEEEGESGSYFSPGAFEGAISSKFIHKKKKNFQHKYIARSYNAGNDFSYESRLDGKSANRVLTFTGKRPSSNPNVGPIPTKRVRTASRQRAVCPFVAGPTGSLQITNKTDVSSGDTNSLQDDQSSMQGGSQSRKNMEVESTADFEKQCAFDGSETSAISKKKKSKLPGYSNFLDSGVQAASEKGSMFVQRLQADSMVPQDQRDKVKKRLESQHHESNGHMVGVYGQHAGKKPKLVKQLIDPLQEAIIPATGSTPSPVASQMSNMSNQNKFIKIIANRDRGRKSKAMKIAAGQSSSDISWTTFEDQALIVFVHDMGPNWELVSDAINNTLQFKRIFRKPKECKERHKTLMEKSAGDGADSAEDSGSSQPYPSTLPGIPKGSAGLLFQRLQGPMEEDTLKDHFEKIISIGQKLHFCRSQKDSQELKQIAPVHNSHYVALSQTCPNNLGGGFLTPFDLSDSISSPDVLTVGYQGPPASSGTITSQQGSPSSVLSTSSGNTMLQGPSGIVLGSNTPSPTPMNAPARDAQRYCIPRAASLPVDEQQKMQYAQMLSGRNIQQASMSVNGALVVGVDRGTHMLPSGNGMGMMGGRATPMPRPGFQNIMSPVMPMVSTGGMLANGGVRMPNPIHVHHGAVPGPGNSMLRPHDAFQMPRPGQNTEDHRQMMMMQDLQMQVSQGNSQTMPPFSAMSAPFSTTTGLLPSVPAYPPQSHQMLGSAHHPQIQGMNHSNPQQAYTMRLGKERQLQQRMLPQYQQPSYSSSSSMSQIQSNSQLKQHTQPSCAPPTSSQPQHNKQQQMPRNPQSSSGMPNQIMKQRQRQQAHPHQQKQLLQQQQPKLVKGLSGGPMLMHQNLPVDPSQLSNTPAAPRNHGFFPGSSSLNSTLPHLSNNHKLYTQPPTQTSKQMPPLPSHSDSMSSSIPLAVSSPPLQQQRQTNQNMQRMMLQQNRNLSTDGRTQSSGDPQVQPNHMIPASSLPRCTDSSSSAPLVSSVMKEASCDTSSATPKTHLDSLPGRNMVGNDTSVSSGRVSMDGHGVGRQWHAQQQNPQQQTLSQMQLQQQQQQHRQGLQDNLYVRPSNSGPG